MYLNRTVDQISLMEMMDLRSSADILPSLLAAPLLLPDWTVAAFAGSANTSTLKLRWFSLFKSRRHSLLLFTVSVSRLTSLGCLGYCHSLCSLSLSRARSSLLNAINCYSYFMLTPLKPFLFKM